MKGMSDNENPSKESLRREALNSARLDTVAIRAGHVRSAEGEHSEAMFLTSSYVFDNAEHAAARFAGSEPGNVYSRYTNPTVRTFEERIAALEGGEMAVATASGMAAILSVCVALLKSGDHVVCSRSVFGTTTVIFTKYLAKFGIDTTFVALTDNSAWADAIKANTKLLFLETPSNPLNEVADLTALSALAKQRGCLLVVDNCFCTPALQKPLDLGADIVVHSATKYLDGQGRCLGGAVVGRREQMNEVLGFLRSAGPTFQRLGVFKRARNIASAYGRSQPQRVGTGAMAGTAKWHRARFLRRPGVASAARTRR
jgi:O-succinylhomoserine sulfhydrylase